MLAATSGVTRWRGNRCLLLRSGQRGRGPRAPSHDRWPLQERQHLRDVLLIHEAPAVTTAGIDDRAIRERRTQELDVSLVQNGVIRARYDRNPIRASEVVLDGSQTALEDERIAVELGPPGRPERQEYVVEVIAEAPPPARLEVRQERRPARELRLGVHELA